MAGRVGVRTEHPAAALFPVLKGAELQELADDIRDHGLLEPIELLDGTVLDGRSRLAACELAGVEPDFTEANIDDLGPTVYVVSKNLKRRHLKTGQRAAIVQRMQPLLAEEAKERQREHGGTAPGRVANTSALKTGSVACQQELFHAWNSSPAATFLPVERLRSRGCRQHL